MSVFTNSCSRVQRTLPGALSKVSARSFSSTLYCRNIDAEAESLKKALEPDMKRAERTLQRFWKETTLALDAEKKSFNVLLDKRKLKTTGGKLLEIPKDRRLLATLVAHEWERQDKALKSHSLPLTSLVGRALDDLINPETRTELINSLVQFLHTDAVCFFGDHPPKLVELQDKHWRPLIDWINKTYGLEIEPYTGFFNTKQDKATVDKLRSVIEKFDEFKLAAFERAVLSSKSFIIALALIEGQISVEEAAKCAHVEVQTQIDRWGEVEDTHDVDFHDIRVRLGSASILLRENPYKN